MHRQAIFAPLPKGGGAFFLHTRHMDLQTLIDRRAAYLAAEQAVLKRQQYTINVDGGSRSVTFANLADIQRTIQDLDAQIERAQNAASGRRRVRYIRHR